MVTSHLIRWFSRPTKCDAPAGRPQAIAPALAARRTPRSSAAVPTVQVAVSQTSDDMVIRVKGEGTVAGAGALLDGLLAPAARRPTVVTLDLSELRSISSLAMGVLVGYRRGVVRAGGRVHLAEQLQPAVKEALARAELLDLFESTADAAAPNRQAGPTPRRSSHFVAV